mmetsp:Transcript_25573/g.70575  ORF Transcript_25573/g.70575 Transcript_25573/m.70575 type:complete len:300 (+) Transcript_25573:835-1734(+)
MLLSVAHLTASRSLSRPAPLTCCAPLCRLRSLEMASGLRRGTLLRRSFAFPTTPTAVAAAAAAAPPRRHDEVPFFPLRRPIAEGEVRRLNLFEPRWLALMDELGGGSSEGLPGATLGCLHALNKCYYEEEEQSSRKVDVVVRRIARRVRVLDCEEGTRPVTGNRRLVVHIVGEDEVQVDEHTLRGHPAGFLVGAVFPMTDQSSESASNAAAANEGRGDDAAAKGAEAGDASVVCVVGLAHANGVLKRCAERGLSFYGIAGSVFASSRAAKGDQGNENQLAEALSEGRPEPQRAWGEVQG